jgi:cell division protein ZapA
MASVTLDVAGRRYTIGCQPGDEKRLTELGQMIDDKAKKSLEILGGDTTEARRLLFASLLLADALADAQAALAGQGGAPAAVAPPVSAPAPHQAALDALAARLERLADKLEHQP